MILFDHRMVEGSPLQYYTPHNYSYSPPQQYQFFNRFDINYNMSEDILMPPSPNSIQSDSENSISSIDVYPNSNHNEKKESIQCCWRSCGIKFDSLDQLATHVGKVHAASGPGGLFYCGWEGCTRNNRGFNARYKMLVHVRTHTNEKPHQCFQCDKSFSRAENLKIHTRSHSGEKPYICPVPGCNKAYSNSSDRFKHTRTHQVDKPYHCKVPGCSKRYTDPSSLRKHVKTYKHFVNENSKITELPITDSDLQYKNQEMRKQCDCKHNCCVSNCLSRAAELLKLGAFINFKETEINSMHWNQLLNPFINEPKKIFTPYDLKTDMDIDRPLDLSISRK